MGDLYTCNISAGKAAKFKACGIDSNFQIVLENVPISTVAAIDHINQQKKTRSIYGDKFNKLLKDGDIYYPGVQYFFHDSRVSAITLHRKIKVTLYGLPLEAVFKFSR
jgi:hypothetical protein